MAFSPETYALCQKNTSEQIGEALTSVYNYKGVVDTLDDLPLYGNKIGDFYDVRSEGGQNYGWDGEKWDSLGFNREATENNLGLIRTKDNTFNNTTFVGDLTAINSEKTSIAGNLSIGNNNTLKGSQNFIIGTANNINGASYNIIGGYNNTIKDTVENSITVGYNNIENYNNSILVGESLENSRSNQAIFGERNLIPATKDLLIIGNGYTDSDGNSIKQNAFIVNRDGEIYSGKRLNITKNIPEKGEIWIYPDKNYDIILNNPNLNDIGFSVYDINKNSIYDYHTNFSTHNFKTLFNSYENAYCMRFSIISSNKEDASISYKSIMVDYYSAPETDIKIEESNTKTEEKISEIDSKVSDIQERIDNGEFGGFSPIIETENKTILKVIDKDGTKETEINDGVVPVYNEQTGYVEFKNALNVDSLVDMIYGGES